jgi:hypothetical protein
MRPYTAVMISDDEGNDVLLRSVGSTYSMYCHPHVLDSFNMACKKREAALLCMHATANSRLSRQHLHMIYIYAF